MTIRVDPTKIGPIFLGLKFSSPDRSKIRADWAKLSGKGIILMDGPAKFGPIFFGPINLTTQPNPNSG